jgi:hypothetical protein
MSQSPVIGFNVCLHSLLKYKRSKYPRHIKARIDIVLALVQENTL